jgi:hypothetical protein
VPDDLLRQLRVLEDEYAGQPLVAQRADLLEINRIRAQLGMPLVDSRLKVIGAAEPVVEAAKPKPKEVQDHTEARAIYHTYLKKTEELEVHKAYADQVVKATAGSGQTRVRPLATMGTNGGPLLCDHCGKPIVLEGGQFHGVSADDAWKKKPTGNWSSWILGGMVVEIQTNDTLRIYHGYPGRHDAQCCNAAKREDKKARDQFESGKCPETGGMLLAFLEHEFPDKTRDERLTLLNQIVDTLYSYDPGIGVNRPDGRS